MVKGFVLLCSLLASVAVCAADDAPVSNQTADKVLAPAPTQEPIFIESDSLDIDESKGVSIYRGNVKFRQGAASLAADVITVHARQRQDVEKIIAVGSPARFKHLAQTDEEQDSSGEAKRIEYYAADALIVLDGEARFQQGDSHFAGSRVEYESDKKIVRAGKNVSGGEGRVQIVIQPQPRNGNGLAETPK